MVRWFDFNCSIVLILCITACLVHLSQSASVHEITSENEEQLQLKQQPHSNIKQVSENKTIHKEIDEHRQKISAGLTEIIALKSASNENETETESQTSDRSSQAPAGSSSGLHKRIGKNSRPRDVSVGTQTEDFKNDKNAATAYNSASDVDYTDYDSDLEPVLEEPVATTGSVWEGDTTDLLTTGSSRTAVKRHFHDFLLTRAGGIFIVSLVVIVLFIIIVTPIVNALRHQSDRTGPESDPFFKS